MSMDKLAKLLDLAVAQEPEMDVTFVMGGSYTDIYLAETLPDSPDHIVNQPPRAHRPRIEQIKLALDEAIGKLESRKETPEQRIFKDEDTGQRFKCVEILDEDK